MVAPSFRFRFPISFSLYDSIAITRFSKIANNSLPLDGVFNHLMGKELLFDAFLRTFFHFRLTKMACRPFCSGMIDGWLLEAAG